MGVWCRFHAFVYLVMLQVYPIKKFFTLSNTPTKCTLSYKKAFLRSTEEECRRVEVSFTFEHPDVLDHIRSETSVYKWKKCNHRNRFTYDTWWRQIINYHFQKTTYIFHFLVVKAFQMTQKCRNFRLQLANIWQYKKVIYRILLQVLLQTCLARDTTERLAKYMWLSESLKVSIPLQGRKFMVQSANCGLKRNPCLIWSNDVCLCTLWRENVSFDLNFLNLYFAMHST